MYAVRSSVGDMSSSQSAGGGATLPNCRLHRLNRSVWGTSTHLSQRNQVPAIHWVFLRSLIDWRGLIVGCCKTRQVCSWHTGHNYRCIATRPCIIYHTRCIPLSPLILPILHLVYLDSLNIIDSKITCTIWTWYRFNWIDVKKTKYKSINQKWFVSST